MIEHIDTNDTQIFGEYFVYILNNILKINTNNVEKNIFILCVKLIILLYKL